MYTSALGGGGYRNRDKVYIRYLYTRNRMMMMMMMTTTMTMMTMLLTTLYICTCKQNVRKQKQFGRYTGTLPYYLDLPDGQLMIGSKVVSTVEVGWTLSLSLITKGKKSFLDCPSFYLHGEDQIKKKSLLQDYSIQLSPSLFLFLIILY